MRRKILSAFLASVFCICLISGVLFADGPDAAGFVSDLYVNVLGRNPDSEGLSSWVSSLEQGKTTGAAVAYGFIFGDEFRARGLDDAAYVDVLYQALLGRNADEAGRAGWVNELASGMSRETLFSGFVNSQEFFDHCRDCGITGGTYLSGKSINTVSKTNLFIERLYQTTLSRSADRQGMYNWTASIVNGSGSGANAAYGFFFSPEYSARDRSDEEYVTDLYRAMLDRAPDSEGLQSWIDLLDSGYTRELVFAGFVYSPEFTAICSSYGIARGDYSANGWCFSGGNRIYIRNGSRLTGWASIEGEYYFFSRSNGALATNTTVNGINVDDQGRAEMTDYAREKIPVMIKAREIYLSICNPSMSVYDQQMACCEYIMAFPYLMKDYIVGRHAHDWADITAHYANNLLNAYGDQIALGGECFAEASALAYLFNEIDAGQVYVNRDEMHGWVEMNGMYWDPLFAESRGRHYLNMSPSNYEWHFAPVQYAI